MQAKCRRQVKARSNGSLFCGSSITGFTLIEILVSMLLISIAVTYSISSILSVTKGMNEDRAVAVAVANSSAIKNRLEQYIIEQVAKGSTAIPLSFVGACGTQDAMEQFICNLNAELSNSLKQQMASALTIAYLPGSALSGQYCYLNASFTVRNNSISQTILQRNFVVNCNAKQV
jgi:prepilin-type N-terminal cleavage/methylation domain-containing protein